MMQMLKRVIARLSGTTTAQDNSQTTVEPMQTVGLAHPELTARNGNKPSAEPTRRRRQPVQSSTKPNSSVAQPTTRGRSSNKESKPVQTTSGKRGRPRKTAV